MKKALAMIEIAYKLLAGVSAGYFVMKATEEKADDLLDDGGMVNAFVIGAGQAAISLATGALVYYVV